MTRSIIVTDSDVDRLRRLVRALKCSLFRDQRQLELLDQRGDGAESGQAPTASPHWRRHRGLVYALGHEHSPR
jgi:hypothetical protein